MSTTKHGSKNALRQNKPPPPDPALSVDEGKTLIHLMTAGAEETMLADHMRDWPPEKKTEGWQLIAEYFRACSEFNPEQEFGKAVARLTMLFHNSIKIQDFKAALSIQKELNKLLSLYHA